MRRIVFWVMLIAVLVLTGCWSRNDKPDIDENGLSIYTPKNSEDVSTRITLCKKISKRTGKPLKVGNIFGIKENDFLRAFIEIENRYQTKGDLLFHALWIGPDGKSFFLKETVLTPADSTSSFVSSISLSPNFRQPGEYLLRLYHFRELVAEKKFLLVPFEELPEEPKIEAQVLFCKRIERETGKPVDIDSVFKTSKKGKIFAVVDLKNLIAGDDVELKLRFEWRNPGGKVIFRKKESFFPDEDFATFRSSISIPPDKRKPGIYSFRVYLSNRLLAEKKFELKGKK